MYIDTRASTDYRAALAEAYTRLNDYQRAIVDRIVAQVAGGAPPQAIRVPAVAGAGKSETLAVTYGKLIEAGVGTSEIIMTTFTRKAGEEMRSRCKKYTPRSAHQGIEDNVKTFHSLALRWLRAEDAAAVPGPSNGWRWNKNLDVKDEDGAIGGVGDDDEDRTASASVTDAITAYERVEAQVTQQIASLEQKYGKTRAEKEKASIKKLGDHAVDVLRRAQQLRKVPEIESIDQATDNLKVILASIRDKMTRSLRKTGIIESLYGDGMILAAGVNPKWERGLYGLEVSKREGAADDAGPYLQFIGLVCADALTYKDPEAQERIRQAERNGLAGIGDIWRTYEEVKAAVNAFDFDDALYQFWKRGTRHCRFIAVDEAQDNTRLQLYIAAKLAGVTGPTITPGQGTLVFVGDSRQCIPAGQYVLCPEGPRRIEDIQVGDRVVTSRGGSADTACVTQVSTTQKTSALEFTTETGRVFQATPEHVLFASIGKPLGYYVYLMWRADYGFRIGSTSSSDEVGLKSLIIRTQQEHAERLWILHAVPDAQEAHLLEHQIAYRYRVPMAPFKPRPGTMFRSEEEALSFFSEFRDNGYKVLSDYEQNFEYPAYVAKASHRGRPVINLLMSSAKGYSEIAVESQHIPLEVQAKWGFTPTKLGCMRIRKYPSTVRAAEAMAEALQADIPDSFISRRISIANEARARTVRAAGVHPGMYVPEMMDGETRLVQVVSRRRVDIAGPCFDMEVERSANFVVVGDRSDPSGGVVVHNSIYSFRGASPAIFASADTLYGAATMSIPTNYRSLGGITGASNALCYGEPWAIGDAAIPARSGAMENMGEVEVNAYQSSGALITGIAGDIQTRVKAGEDPAKFAILCPKNIQCMTYAAALFRVGVPCLIIGQGTSFYATKNAKLILRLATLCTDFPFGAMTRTSAHSALESWYINSAVDAFDGLNALPYVKSYLKYLSAPVLVEILDGGLSRVAATDPGPVNIRRIIAALRMVTRNNPILRNQRSAGKNIDRWVTGISRLANLLGHCVEQGWPKMLTVIREHAFADPDRAKREAERAERVAAGELIESGEDSSQYDQVQTLCSGFATYGSVGEILHDAHQLDRLLDEDKNRAKYHQPERSAARISTIHKFKGLQAKHTYVDITKTGWREGVSALDDPDDPQAGETQRLLYVAVSRPEDRLVMSYATRDDQNRPAGPSFLAEPIMGYLRDARAGKLDWPIMRPRFEHILGAGYALFSTYADLRQGTVIFRKTGAQNEGDVTITEVETGKWQVRAADRDVGTPGTLDEVLRWADIAMNGAVEDPVDDFLRFLRQVGSRDALAVADWVYRDAQVQANVRTRFTVWRAGKAC